MNDFYDDMMGTRLFDVDVPRYFDYSRFSCDCYFYYCKLEIKSVKINNGSNHVEGKKADFVNNRDVFVRKSLQTPYQTSGGVAAVTAARCGGGSHGGGHSR